MKESPGFCCSETICVHMCTKLFVYICVRDNATPHTIGCFDISLGNFKYIYIYIYTFIISLIIHEEKTREISGVTVVEYLIQNSADLHKL